MKRFRNVSRMFQKSGHFKRFKGKIETFQKRFRNFWCYQGIDPKLPIQDSGFKMEATIVKKF